MDTKSTKNKSLKDLEKYIGFILLIFFSISLVRTLGEYNNFKLNFEGTFYDGNLAENQLVFLDESLIEYTNLFLDLDGNRKEDVYKEKVEEDKFWRENETLETIESNIREKAEDMNLSEEEIKKKIEDEKKNINIKEDNSAIEDYFNGIKEHINNIIRDNRNIEFFLKDNSGAKITNIEDSGIEKQIEENNFTDNDDYYYMYFPSSKAKGNKGSYSKELSKIYNSMRNPSNSINYNSEDLVRFYRIPKELKQGDLLYEEFLNRKEATTVFNKKIITTSILGILTLVFIFIIYKNRKNKFTSYIEDLLIKIPIDIRGIIFIYSINVLKSLIFNVIPYYGNNYYSNEAILKSYLFIIFDYYFLKDVIFIIGEKRNLGNILTKKYLIILFHKLRSCYIVRTTAFRINTIIFMTALAIWCTIMINYFNYWNYLTLIIAQIYVILYLIILTSYVIIVFGEVNILNVKSRKIVEGKYEKEEKKNKMIIFKEIEGNILNIENGLNRALDKAIKSEKMKSELITNVSHDLKTPLTSIINYIDLLKEEDINDEKRKKYLEVLDMKSKRLKVLIEDLFEASKAVSGNMSFEREELNIVSLLRQVIGELEEKINQANLDIITKWPKEKAILYLDGRKTFRVYENLVNNIIKYSMKNSRVYIDVINSKNEVVVIMKNISAYQIDFNSEEIIERFKRGDKARSTEGSGLGLSIAKSIVELQGGEFNIEIDGDLFKVTTKFKK